MTVTVSGIVVETSFLEQVLPTVPGTVKMLVFTTGLVVEPTELVQMVLTLQVDLEDVVDDVFVVFVFVVVVVPYPAGVSPG